jgi:hypothetical protein
MRLFTPTLKKSVLPAGVALSILTLFCHAQETETQRTTVTISNQTMVARLSSARGVPELQIKDVAADRSISLAHLFTIKLKDGSTLQPLSLQWRDGFRIVDSSAGEKQICAALNDPHTGADFHWCLLVRPGSHYMREKLTIGATDKELAMTDVRLLDFQDASARVSGSVKGSPVVDGRMFFGFEHPLSWSRVVGGNVQAGILRVLPLRVGQTVTFSAVFGTAQPGQMRRAFLAYIEDERPRPYQPFLDYTTWYDIGYENRYSEADVLSRIHAFGDELVKQRHVELDSFMLDDGWDNPNSFWQFNNGFPDGLTNLAKAADEVHAGIGIWLSPWGGYAEQKVERIRNGKAHGYEIIHDGFALSGPKYYRDFSRICMQMVDHYNVNQFKFDGTGNADSVFPDSTFDSDFDAAIHLIGRVRAAKPGIFINLSTGTYPSPFWLFYSDSIWRGGDDHSFAGVGTSRQRWITYRDEETYRNIVLKGPLYPLNSLMLHGIIYAKQADGLKTDPGNDFADEVQSYFGTGTQLQEMYITPSLLSNADWDTLANAAKWSRAHTDILKDTHWIGGDPGRLQVYGWAAWAPIGWIVTLRNPSNVAQDFSLNLKSALELPEGSARSYAIKLPFESHSKTSTRWQTDRFVPIHMKPFEVQTFESSTLSAQP